MVLEMDSLGFLLMVLLMSQRIDRVKDLCLNVTGLEVVASESKEYLFEYDK